MAFDSNVDNPLETVKTKEDFLHFLEWLAADFWDDIDSWQNRDVDQYLKAVSSWIESQEESDSSSKEFLSNKETNWNEIAGLFYVGKMYE